MAIEREQSRLRELVMTISPEDLPAFLKTMQETDTRWGIVDVEGEEGRMKVIIMRKYGVQLDVVSACFEVERELTREDLSSNNRKELKEDRRGYIKILNSGYLPILIDDSGCKRRRGSNFPRFTSSRLNK